MALTEEQVNELKKQLSTQIQHLPEDQKHQAQQHIDQMSPDALESMLKQQQSQQPGPSAQGSTPSPEQVQQVFRMIVSGNIPAKKIFEDKDSIAVLDIKPISKGHVVIIPKEAAANTKGLPDSVFSLAKAISKALIDNLKANGTEIQTEFKFGEIIINVIPVYDKPVNITSPRTDAKEEELTQLQNQLKNLKPESDVIKIVTKKSGRKKKLKLKRKIP